MIVTLSSGGSSKMLISLIPTKLICIVLGIGVADKDNTSIFSFIFFKVSLCLTPNLCSSSIIRSPKSLNSKFFDNNLCVPISKFTFPFFTFFKISFCFAGLLNLLSISISTGKFPTLSIAVL